MAKILPDNGVHPMHATTVARIDAGDRSVRINEAVGIAELFEESLDSLLGLKRGPQRSAVTYRLRVFRDTTDRSCQQVRAITETMREQIEELLPGEFDGAAKLRKMGYNTLRNSLDPASEALWKLFAASDALLHSEQKRLEASEQPLKELEVPQDGEAQSSDRVEDRWTKAVRDEHGNNKKVPSANYGRGKRWRARYVDDQGHERAKAFDRKRDAEVWLDNEVTAKLATGTYVAPKAGLISVEEVYTSWSAGQAHISPKTAEHRRAMWRNHVLPRWGNVNVVDVKTSAVKAWVTKMLADGVGVPTANHSFGLLRQVLGAAVEDSRIPRNPCAGGEAA